MSDLNEALNEDLNEDLFEDLNEALTDPRINWNRVIALGGDLRAIANEARAHGDQELYRRATRAADRRGL